MMFANSEMKRKKGFFNRIIKKHGGIQKGFPELMKVMEKRLGELKNGKATKL